VWLGVNLVKVLHLRKVSNFHTACPSFDIKLVVNVARLAGKYLSCMNGSSPLLGNGLLCQYSICARARDGKQGYFAAVQAALDPVHTETRSLEGRRVMVTKRWVYAGAGYD
jgi:hypothetical protein